MRPFGSLAVLGRKDDFEGIRSSEIDCLGQRFALDESNKNVRK